jgi:agmatine/peptidylarginine deiminase
MAIHVRHPISSLVAALAATSALRCGAPPSRVAPALHVPGASLREASSARAELAHVTARAAPVLAPRRRLVGDAWLAAGHDFDDTLRGDWDTSSALLVVYNSSWRRPLRRLLSFAHSDLPVYVLATPEATRSSEFTRWLRGVPFAGLVSIDLDTPWIRDYGPLEVQRSRGISWLDMVYAPEDRPLDDAVPTLLGEVFETPNEPELFHLDGGGIISSGDGLCGITEASFEGLELDTGDSAQVERFLQTVGCRTLARLPALPSESTGHVDMVAQFLSPHQVAIAVPTSKSPPAVREALERAREALTQAATVHGKELEFVDLPIVSHKERYYSYVNGLRTPSHYFVPSYSNVDRKLEAQAHRRLAEALTGVTVIGVDSDEMIQSGGAIHCVTLGLKQQLVPRVAGERIGAPLWARSAAISTRR